MNKVVKKKVVSLQPIDFPCAPDTGDNIPGIKSIELLDLGYEFTRYLEKRIDEGTLALKDVVIEMCGEDEWKDFCDEYEHPETNADAFSDMLSDNRPYNFRHIFVAETDTTIILCAIASDDYDRADDFECVVRALCTLSHSDTSNKPTDTVCLGKVVDVKTETTAKVNEITAPLFMKL